MEKNKKILAQQLHAVCDDAPHGLVLYHLSVQAHAGAGDRLQGLQPL